MDKLDTPSLRKEYAGDMKALAERLSDWQQEWGKAYKAQHEAMRRSHDFYHGIQMPEEDRKKLESAGKPIITVNKVASAVDAMYGAVIHNALGFSYVSPKPTDGDGVLRPRVDEVMGGAARFIRSLYGAEGKDRGAIIDMLVGGIGAQEMRTDTTCSRYVEVVADHLDPFSVCWDTRAKESGLVDRRWDAVTRFLSDEEFEDEFGVKPEKGASEGIVGDPNTGLLTDPTSHADDPNRIYRWQWYEIEKYRVFTVAVGVNQDGTPQTKQIDVNPGEEDDTRQQYAMEDGTSLVLHESSPRKRRAFWQATTSGGTIMEVHRIGVNKFTRTFLTGKRDRDGVWYGVVRHAESPQLWANAFFSSIIYIIASGGKGYMAERSVFVDPDSASADWSRPDKFKIVEDDALSKGRIQQIEPQKVPPGMADMASMSIAFVSETIGASLELRGQQTNQQSGVTENSRQDASIGVIGWVFAELREFYQRHGRLLLDFMTKYTDPGRLILMSTNEDEFYQQFQPPGEDVHYDVVVDDVPSSPNRRNAVFRALSSLVPFFQLKPDEIPPGTGMALLRSSHLPGDVISRLEQNAQKPNPEAERAKQIAMETQVAELKKLVAEAQEVNAQAMLNMAKAQSEESSSQAAARIAAVDTERAAVQNAIEIAAKQDKAEVDIRKDMAKLQMEVQRMQNQLEMQREQGRIRLEQQRQKGTGNDNG